MKICSICKQTKSLENFTNQNNRPEPKVSWCKACAKAKVLSKRVPVVCKLCKKQFVMPKSVKAAIKSKNDFIRCRQCGHKAGAKKLVIWDNLTIATKAKEYTSRSEFYKQAGGAYNKAIKLKILDKVCTHMTGRVDRFRKTRNKSGVYQLLLKGKIVYIGKSNTCLSLRLARHLDDADKLFDNIIVYLIDGDSDVNVIEMYLINKYKPLYNKGDLGNTTLNVIINNITDFIKEKITFGGINDNGIYKGKL